MTVAAQTVRNKLAPPELKEVERIDAILTAMVNEEAKRSYSWLYPFGTSWEVLTVIKNRWIMAGWSVFYDSGYINLILEG